MKKVGLSTLAVLLVILCLSGCSPYSSSYRAVGHVHSNTSDSARMSFLTFEGTEVFRLKPERGKPASIGYSGKPETGSLTVQYACGETRTELFSMHSGDEVHARSEALNADTVYIIIEAKEPCENGNPDFEIICD